MKHLVLVPAMVIGTLSAFAAGPQEGREPGTGDLGRRVQAPRAPGWSRMASGTTNNLTGIWGRSPDDVFAVGPKGTILHFDGRTWSPMQVAGEPHLLSVWGSSGRDVFVVGDGGVIIHYDGQAWTPMASGTKQNLISVWGTSSRDVFVAGYGGTVLHYDGTTWTRMVTGTTADLYGIWGTSSNHVVAAGGTPMPMPGKGLILSYDGERWSPMTIPDSPFLAGVWGSSQSNAFAVGVNLAILHFNGKAWAPMAANAPLSPGKPNLLVRVWCSGPNDAFASGFDGVLLHYDGKAWAPGQLGTAESLSVFGFSPDDVFAVGGGGTILRYTGEPASRGADEAGPVDAAAQTTIALPDVQKPHQIVVEGNDLYVFDEADYSLHAYTISPFAPKLRMGRKGDGPYDFKYLPFLYLRPDALVFTDFTKTLWFSRKGGALKVKPYTELKAFLLDEETLLIPVKDRYVKITADHVRDKRHVQLLDSGFATLKELYVGPFTWQALAPVHHRTDTVGYEDLILISDTQKGFHIAVFDLDGRHVRTIDLSREVEPVGTHPLMHQYSVSNGRIYATTYKKVGGKTEMLVLDLEGRLLRRLYLPLASIRPTRGVLRFDLFCVDGERLYELVEDRETGKWELVITDLRQAG